MISSACSTVGVAYDLRLANLPCQSRQALAQGLLECLSEVVTMD